MPLIRLNIAIVIFFSREHLVTRFLLLQAAAGIAFGFSLYCYLGKCLRAYAAKSAQLRQNGNLGARFGDG